MSAGSAEQRLWREVIDCAFRDAVELPRLWFGSRSRDHLERHRARLQDEARSWLLSGGQDFVLVCDLADRCPVEVRDQARRLLGDPQLVDAFVHGRRELRSNRPYATSAKRRQSRKGRSLRSTTRASRSAAKT